MPDTGTPNYTDVISRPIWPSGSSTNATGQRRVVSGKDEILADDINSLREIIDISFVHTHPYHDSIGSC